MLNSLNSFLYSSHLMLMFVTSAEDGPCLQSCSSWFKLSSSPSATSSTLFPVWFFT